MRRTLLLVLAMLAVLVSLAWGVAVLRTDVVVDADPAAYDTAACGSAYAVLLDGGPIGGGEVRRPNGDACVDAARDHLRWAALPLLAGLLGAGYVVVRWRGVQREAAGRSNHPDAKAPSGA